MEPSSEAKRPSIPTVSAEVQTLDRVPTALEKCNQLMERHLAAGELTVPARAVYFVLRDAGFGSQSNPRGAQASSQAAARGQ
jgi:hypothetical protein